MTSSSSSSPEPAPGPSQTKKAQADWRARYNTECHQAAHCERDGKVARALAHYQRAMDIALEVRGADLMFCQSKIAALTQELVALNQPSPADSWSPPQLPAVMVAAPKPAKKKSRPVNNAGQIAESREPSPANLEEMLNIFSGGAARQPSPPPAPSLSMFGQEAEVDPARDAFTIFKQRKEQEIYQKFPGSRTKQSIFESMAQKFWKGEKHKDKYERAAKKDQQRFKAGIAIDESNKFPF